MTSLLWVWAEFLSTGVAHPTIIDTVCLWQNQNTTIARPLYRLTVPSTGSAL
jgi:hypothetical protein